MWLLTICARKCKKRARRAHCHSERKSLSPWKGSDSEERSAVGERSSGELLNLRKKIWKKELPV